MNENLLRQQALSTYRQPPRPSVADYADHLWGLAKDAGLVGLPFEKTPIGVATATSGRPLAEQLAARTTEDHPAMGFVGAIKAYHGSPHNFDKFDSAKIGTGEGAQAYGHGLYFAEKEGVARTYRDALSDGEFRLATGEPYNAKDINHFAAATLKEYPTPDRAVADLTRQISELQKVNADWVPEAVAQKQATIDAIKRGGLPELEEKSFGNMYEVKIDADENNFLDWDAPLSNQPDVVKDYFGSYGIKHDAAAQREFDDALLAALMTDAPTTVPKQPSNPTGESLYRRLGSGPRAPMASERLKQAGVKGIKYLDQDSRRAGEGSRNYVVFDPSIVEILRKYGIAAPMVGLGAAYGDDQ